MAAEGLSAATESQPETRNDVVKAEPDVQLDAQVEQAERCHDAANDEAEFIHPEFLEMVRERLKGLLDVEGCPPVTFRGAHTPAQKARIVAEATAMGLQADTTGTAKQQYVCVSVNKHTARTTNPTSSEASPPEATLAVKGKRGKAGDQRGERPEPHPEPSSAQVQQQQGTRGGRGGYVEVGDGGEDLIFPNLEVRAGLHITVHIASNYGFKRITRGTISEYASAQVCEATHLGFVTLL
ncbi:hypothetical protein JKP88DRAFT_243236 [Tribonema minus]|uniref:Uncharacterized protein n=1 Tax=Tribonema minus TaxID=303371 RepID=A0A835ZAV9_9STRA|nr:hypothetical protein JKP88DRAFT_243236 [Tribonema minus]